MMNDGMYSSNKDDWRTPKGLFKRINDIFQFDLDPCASDKNHMCELYFTKEDNGLEQDWVGNVFMNPPYGRVVTEWVKKAYNEVMNENADVVVCLLPARTDTRWFHDYCIKGEIWFIKGRLSFSGGGTAPFPSMLVIFKKNVINCKVCTIDR